MKTPRILPLLAGTMLAATIMTTTPSSAQNNANSSVAQSGPAAQNPVDPETAQNQPFMATGEDLKGPPRQFSARQTPE